MSSHVRYISFLYIPWDNVTSIDNNLNYIVLYSDDRLQINRPKVPHNLPQVLFPNACHCSTKIIIYFI